MSNNTKEKLLEIAIELFWLQSFGSVSVDEICRKAGVNKGSFYHFFPSKIDFALEAFQTLWREEQPRLDNAFAPELAPEDRLRNFCMLCYGKQKEKVEQYGKVLGCPFSTIASELATQDERVRQCIDDIFHGFIRYFETLVRDARAAGRDVGVGTETQLAHQMVAYVTGVEQHAKFCNDVEIIRELMLPGLLNYVGRPLTSPVKNAA